MKQIYLSLLLAGLTAAPALGQKTTVNAFPKPLAPVANAGMKAPQFHLPSAIDDKKKGITMYAGQRLDQSKHRSWVKWQTGDSFNFTKIYEYIHHDKYNEDQQRGIYMGAYDSSNDTYYAFFNMHYTYGDMPMALAPAASRSPPTISRLAFTSCAPPTATRASSRRWWSAKYFLVLAPSWRGGRRKSLIEAGWKAVVLSSCLCLYLCLLRLPIYSPIKRQHE